MSDQDGLVACQIQGCGAPATHAEPLPGSVVKKCEDCAVDGAIPLSEVDGGEHG